MLAAEKLCLSRADVKCEPNSPTNEGKSSKFRVNKHCKYRIKLRFQYGLKIVARMSVEGKICKNTIANL